MDQTEPEIAQGWVTPEFFDDPYPFYDELRRRDPVCWSNRLNGWVVTGYAAAEAMLKAPGLFSSAGRMAALLDPLPEVDRSRLGLIYSHFSGGLIRSDPPDHTRLRALISKVFTPRAVENLRPRIQQTVDELLDVVRARTHADLISALAYPLPAIIICELLGVPLQDRDRIRRWAEQISAVIGGIVPIREGAQLMHDALVEIREYLTALIDQRRRRPQGDLLSLLVRAEEYGDRLTLEELLSTAENLMQAGHETTTGLIGNGLWLLLRHPRQLDLLREQPDRLAPAIEEMLRCESPVQRQTRLVAQDHVFAGNAMRKGQLVFIMIGAANRDPAAFEDPHRFDITRAENHHLAFGTGVHFCIGAPLARLEASVALRALLQRFPSLRLSGRGAVWRPHAALRTLRELNVEWDPAGVAHGRITG